MYEYKATVLRVVDGDTVRVQVDLGFDTFQNITLRLYGIDAPELSTTQGQELRTLLKSEIEGKEIIVRTYKDKREKYGRYLATLIHRGEDLNKWLVDSGYAVEWLAK